MYEDQYGEFICGHRGLKGLNRHTPDNLKSKVTALML